jgi:CxxC motif-containing protein (DUF1111 family)
LFNAIACASCHKDGGPARFVVNEEGVAARGLVVRVARPDGSGDPWYGRQIQERAVPGLIPEARIRPRLERASYAGESLERILPGLELTGPALADGTRQEIRVAPSLAGRGLIARVDPEAVLKLADPDDADGDGISGRARFVRDAAGKPVPGRFGLKAARATIEEQVADAAAIDMGLSSRKHPASHGDCTVLEKSCLAAAFTKPGNVEVSDEAITLIGGFVASLKAPAPSAESRAAELFAAAGCAGCHVPHLPDSSGRAVQVFSDLLLHDMGEELGGTIPEDGADVREWRTAPLIDLDPRLGMRRYLHDGRAASIEEAILWHGGEGSRARERFRLLPASERAMLLDYLANL